MKNNLKVYKAKILVMSPTFVGSGKEISKRVDAALAQLKESGELTELSKEWFDADYTEVRPE